MTRYILALLIVGQCVISGCASSPPTYRAPPPSASPSLLGSVLGAINDLDRGFSQAVGEWTAPYLGGSPSPSGCRDPGCLRLDQLETELYGQVRTRAINYRILVQRFYAERSRLFPTTKDGPQIREAIAFQRMLAEHVDAGQVTDTQWVYLVERKNAEIQERMRMGSIRCNTTNTGTLTFPNYQTVCN